MIEMARNISLSDAVQIAVLYFAIYAILKGAKGSRFGQALMGIGVLATLAGVFSFAFHFNVLSRIVQILLIYMAISTVVIFQPEIRRFLQAVGAFGYFETPKHHADGSATPELVVETLQELAKRRMGALIAFERGISLRAYESTGVMTDAIFTPEMVKSIFTPPLPLHDGGVVMRDGRISSAHCIFPVSNNPNLIASGMRHRAAVGLSEETDALVIVVSEERGIISVARNGKLYRYAPAQTASLMRWVSRALPDDQRDTSLVSKLFKPFQRLFVQKEEAEEKP
ncbi:MAG: diadenylate cyclase [Kiritimatiellae bacterium]|nr:diadenylate cyclase [Kiritimatiellia bacterium]